MVKVAYRAAERLCPDPQDIPAYITDPYYIDLYRLTVYPPVHCSAACGRCAGAPAACTQRPVWGGRGVQRGWYTKPTRPCCSTAAQHSPAPSQHLPAIRALRPPRCAATPSWPGCSQRRTAPHRACGGGCTRGIRVSGSGLLIPPSWPKVVHNRHQVFWERGAHVAEGCRF